MLCHDGVGVMSLATCHESLRKLPATDLAISHPAVAMESGCGLRGSSIRIVFGDNVYNAYVVIFMCVLIPIILNFTYGKLPE